MGELDDIEPVLRSHSAALELGCGNGRLCDRMVKVGLRVTGVDESAEMLAHLPPTVEGLCSSIEEMNLDRQWSAVLLPSHLINHPERKLRDAFVAAARRHTAAAGTFFVKRHDPAWLATVKTGLVGVAHGVGYFVEQVARQGSQVTMTLRYELAGQSWTQSFSTIALSESALEDQLTQHGLENSSGSARKGCGFRPSPKMPRLLAAESHSDSGTNPT